MGNGKYHLPGLAGYRFAAVGVCDTGQEVPEVVEVGVTPVDVDGDRGRVGETRTWLVRPAGPLAPWATRAHGLGTLDVQGAPEVAEVAPEIRAAVGDRVVVAHRGLHCHELLSRAVPGFAPDRVLDLRRLVQRVWPGTRSYALGALAHDVDVRPQATPGRAGYEAAATALVFLAAARRVNQPAAELFACCTVLQGQAR